MYKTSQHITQDGLRLISGGGKGKEPPEKVITTREMDLIENHF